MSERDETVKQLEWLRDESARTGQHRRQSVAVRALADLASERAALQEARGHVEALLEGLDDYWITLPRGAAASEAARAFLARTEESEA